MVVSTVATTSPAWIRSPTLTETELTVPPKGALTTWVLPDVTVPSKLVSASAPTGVSSMTAISAANNLLPRAFILHSSFNGCVYILLSASMGLKRLALRAGDHPKIIPTAAEKLTPRIIAP